MSRPSRLGKGLWLIPVAWSGLAVITAAASLVVLHTSFTDAAALRRVAPGPSEAVSFASLSPILREVEADASSPAADVANGLYLARAAALLDRSGERRAVLDTALSAITRAGPARPYWGESSAILAYASMLRDGPQASATLSDFARSYREAPYLPRSGPWRIDFGFANWEQLDRATRKAVIDEAVWYSRKGEVQRFEVFRRARASTQDAYIDFMSVWARSRVGDSGFVPFQRAAP